MAFGTDLKDFVSAFVAGYNLVPSQQQKDKAQADIDQSKASTNLANAQAAAIPATTAYQLSQAKRAEAQSDYYLKRGDAYETMANGKYPGAGGGYDWGSDTMTPGAGALPVSPSYDPSDPSQNPQAAAPAAVPLAPDTQGGQPDQSNYVAPAAPTPQGAGVPDYRTAAPTQLSSAISSTAAQNGVDPAYALTVADIETGGTFNPAAVDPKSGATGLFQFMPSTAAHVGLKDATDPVASTAAMAKLTAQNGQILQQALGRKPTPGELYLAHQQGPTAAALMLNNPSMPALTALTAAYQKAGASNPQGIAARALQENGGNAQMTAGQFAGKWINAFQDRYAKVTGQSNQTAPAPGAPPQGGAPDALGYSGGQTPQGNAAVGAINTAAGPSNGPIDPVKGVIKAGMAVLSNRFMGPAANAAVPATGTPAPNVRGYLSGDTRAQQSDVDQIYARVDPDHKMSDAQRTSAAFAYIAGNTHAPVQAKAAAAADLMQYYRVNFDRYAAIAKVAAGNGNLDDATKAIAKAYDNIPDGQSIQAIKQDGGKYQITIKNDATGEITQQALLSPAEIGAQIEKVTPGFFDQQVAQFASSPTPDKTPLSDTDKQNLQAAQGGAPVSALDLSGSTTQGRKAVMDYYSTQQSTAAKPPTADSNPSSWKADAGTALQTAVSSLTAGPMANMQTPAMASTVKAFQDPKVTGPLTSAITDEIKASKGNIVPEEYGRDIANLIVPGGLSSYDIQKGKSSTTFTSRDDGRSFTLANPVVKNLQDVLTQVQSDEADALKGQQASAAQAAARAKKYNTPNPAAGAAVAIGVTGRAPGGPSAQPAGALPIPPPSTNLGQRLVRNMTTPGGIPLSPLGN